MFSAAVLKLTARALKLDVPAVTISSTKDKIRPQEHRSIYKYRAGAARSSDVSNEACLVIKESRARTQNYEPLQLACSSKSA